MDRAEWLKGHPYLAQLADFEAKVEEEAAAAAAAAAPSPRFEAYAADHANAVPLLRHEPFRSQAIDAGAAVLGPVVERLSGAAFPDGIRIGVEEIADRFRAKAEDCRNAVEWVVNGGSGEAPYQPGLLRHLAWSALARALAPAIAAYEAWRAQGEERVWKHPICPTCGVLPVMAALVPREAGRERRFACGLCRTRWGWQRLGCPYCQNQDPARLDLFEIEGEPGLRLDACQGCTGYVKTVIAEGAPDFLLADWSTIHLDALAKEKGYRRLGASLYDL